MGLNDDREIGDKYSRPVLLAFFKWNRLAIFNTSSADKYSWNKIKNSRSWLDSSRYFKISRMNIWWYKQHGNQVILWTMFQNHIFFDLYDLEIQSIFCEFNLFKLTLNYKLKNLNIFSILNKYFDKSVFKRVARLQNPWNILNRLS